MANVTSGLVQLGTLADPIDYDGAGADTAIWVHGTAEKAIAVDVYSAVVDNEGTPLPGFVVMQDTAGQINVENPLTNNLYDQVIILVRFEVPTPDKSGQIPSADVQML
jgi:hypothetical protein